MPSCRIPSCRMPSCRMSGSILHTACASVPSMVCIGVQAGVATRTFSRRMLELLRNAPLPAPRIPLTKHSQSTIGQYFPQAWPSDQLSELSEAARKLALSMPCHGANCTLLYCCGAAALRSMWTGNRLMFHSDNDSVLLIRMQLMRCHVHSSIVFAVVPASRPFAGSPAAITDATLLAAPQYCLWMAVGHSARSTDSTPQRDTLHALLLPACCD